MWQKNNGEKEIEILQNQFTAYLVKAIIRRRNEYIRQMERLEKEEITENILFELGNGNEEDMFLGLPMLMQLRDNALFHALKELNGRERYILLARVLDEKSFRILAKELNLSYKNVTTVYYRTIQKIKKRMGKIEDEF